MRTRGRMRNRGIRSKQELQELYGHLDTKKKTGMDRAWMEWIMEC